MDNIDYTLFTIASLLYIFIDLIATTSLTKVLRALINPIKKYSVQEKVLNSFALENS